MRPAALELELELELELDENRQVRTVEGGDARAEAVRVLDRWIREGRLPAREMHESHRVPAAVMQIVYGVVRNRTALEWIADRMAGRPPPAAILPVLLAGLYELLFMSGTPAFAATHEAVSLGRAWAGEAGARFVNALLRRAQRESAALLDALSRAPPEIRLSHPSPLFERWARRFGEAGAVALCEWNNQPARPVARLAAGVAPAVWIASMAERGFGVTPHPADPERFFLVDAGGPPARWPGFAEGHFYLQDPSTAWAPALVEARPGESVLDACAAPGGKTICLAEAMQGRGRLLALDRSAARIRPLRENLARLRQPWVEMACIDAAAVAPDGPPPPLDRGFDAVLLDVPCSNTGVIRRRPEARWAFSPERLADLLSRQAALLENAARLVRPGGRIVYSTCSVESEENEGQIRGFLARHPDFTLETERRRVPPEGGTDGAYAARIRTPRRRC